MSTISTPPDITGSVVRPTRTAGISMLAAGPACVVCGLPFIWPALAAIGVGVPVGIAHGISWALVPVVVVLLAVNARRHGDRRPLRLAAVGAGVYGVHVGLHLAPGLGGTAFLITDQVAVALLGGAALWDLAVTRRVRREMSMVRRDQRVGAAFQ